MPDFAGVFSLSIDRALDLASAGENTRVILLNQNKSVDPMTVARIELIYEMAYLRIFLAWEVFLEQTFLRYICGYRNSTGTEPLAAASSYFSSIAAASTAILNGRTYLLWHNPTHVSNRVQNYLANGLHFTVIQSALNDLEWYASIRHRIAHSQEDAKNKFDAATLGLNTLRYKGSKPGVFLRDWNNTLPVPERWLSFIATHLLNLANQITP